MTTLIRSAADIIALAAPLIGFAPTDSIVVYMLRNHPQDGAIVRCVLRFDVNITTAQASNLARTCNLKPRDNDAAILLAICDPSSNAHAVAVLAAVRDSLELAGIPVRRRLLTRSVTERGHWRDVDTDDRGLTYPYTDSAVTATVVANGERVGRSRADIAEEFSPIDPPPATGIGDIHRLLASTGEEIAHILTGERTPSSGLAIRAGLIITADRAARDRVLRLALGHERAASQLWTHIARQLRGRARAEALTVAAVCHTLRGDTVRATIALEIIRDELRAAGATPPALAVLLDEALQHGIHPDRIRDVVAGTLDTPPPAGA